MEVVLGALIDWVHDAIRNRVIRWTLVIAVFSFGCFIAIAEWYAHFN